MADERVVNLTTEITDPNLKPTGNYLLADHAVDGSQKILLDNIKKLITANWGEPEGGCLFDGVDDSVIMPYSDELNVTTNDFTWIFLVKNTTFSTNQRLLSNSVTSVGYEIYSMSGQILFRIYTSSGTENLTLGVIEQNKQTHIAIVKSGKTYTVYIDGVAQTSKSATNDILSTTTPVRLGISTASSFGFYGEYLGFYPFNKALTASEVTQLYNNGRPDLAVVPYKYVGGSQTALTSGTLTIGKAYIIDTYVSGDDFTNVGGTNVTGNEFIATGTTPTTWTNSSSLRQIGNVLDIRPENMGPNGVIDASGNFLNGNTSGNPISIGKKRDAKVGVSTTEIILIDTQKGGMRLKGILAKEKGGVSNSIALGTATGVYDLLSAATGALTANEEKYFEIPASGSYSSVTRDLYTVAGAGTVDIILIYGSID